MTRELNWSDVIYTAPATEPLSLAEAKAHLRVTDTGEDGFILSCLKAAREQVEHDTRRGLITQTRQLYLDRFPSGCDEPSHVIGPEYAILIPRPPLVSISSITYIAADGTSTVLAADQYQVDIRNEPGRVKPAYGCSWPSTREVYNAVTVQYVCGWSALTLPTTVKHLLRLWLGHFFENREPVVIGTIVNDLPFAMKALTGRLEWGSYP